LPKIGFSLIPQYERDIDNNHAMRYFSSFAVLDKDTEDMFDDSAFPTKENRALLGITSESLDTQSGTKLKK
jgi:hypothetical protein